MTDNMIERVAAAIADRLGEGAAFLDDSHPDFHATVHTAEHYLDVARAAIEAMREPTESMATNSFATAYNRGPYGDKEVRRIYRAMIDAALNEKAGT
jgi:hypothetical protein